MRPRFGIAAVLALLHAIGVVLVYAHLDGAPSAWEMSAEDRADVDRVLSAPFAAYLRATWSGDLHVLLAALGAVLGAGGVPSRRRGGTVDLTLSLPVAPGTWLLSHWLLVMLLLSALAFLSGGIVLAGGFLASGSVPGVAITGTMLAAVLGAAHVVAASVLATVWTRDGLAAAVIGLVVVYVTESARAALRESESASWLVLGMAVLTSSILVLAVVRFESADP